MRWINCKVSVSRALPRSVPFTIASSASARTAGEESEVSIVNVSDGIDTPALKATSNARSLTKTQSPLDPKPAHEKQTNQ